MDRHSKAMKKIYRLDRTVECPKCHALPGEACVGVGDFEGGAKGTHVSRTVERVMRGDRKYFLVKTPAYRKKHGNWLGRLFVTRDALDVSADTEREAKVMAVKTWRRSTNKNFVNTYKPLTANPFTGLKAYEYYEE